MVHAATTEVLAVTTTVGSMDDALALARKIVDRRLAACVQLDPVAASVYRWKDAVCQDPEVRLTMKTLASSLQQLQDFIAQHHPYELPQLTWTAMKCTPAYGEWVGSELSGGS